MTLAIGGEALAQCGSGPVIVGPGPNCSISSTTTNDHLSGQAALLDVGSQFMQRFFELAARLRDEISELKKELRQMMEATK